MTTNRARQGSGDGRDRRGTLTLLGVGTVAAAAASTQIGTEARAAARDKKVENFGVPWEESYGYAQAIQVGDTIYLSGQLSHDEAGNFVAPAALDEYGKVVDFTNMGQQLARAYENCAIMLGRFGVTLDDAVEEVVYVLDMESAFAAIPSVRKSAWGKTPVIASTIVETPRLALPPQLCEIKMIAKV